MNFYDFYITATQLSALPPPQPETVGLLYLGPDTVLPLASIIAGAIGIILMFWRRLMGGLRTSYETLFHREQEVVNSPTPDDPGD
jgi:hypothetical protein